jgi:hypothetical protein
MLAGLAFLLIPRVYMIDRTGFPVVAENDETRWLENLIEGLAREGIHDQPRDMMVKSIPFIDRYAKLAMFRMSLLSLDEPIPYWNGTDWQYVDSNGKPVIEGDFFFCHPFSEGIATVIRTRFEDGLENRDRLWSFMKLDGTYLPIGPYYAAGTFSEGLVEVRNSRDEPFVFVNTAGDVVAEGGQFLSGGFSEGLAVVERREETQRGAILAGCIDKTGAMKIELPSNMSALGPFRDGLARVTVFDFSKNNDGVMVGFIDKTGDLVIPPIYDEALDFFEGLAAVKTGGEWGYIDTSGEMVIEPNYLEADSFRRGYAVVIQWNLNWIY